jgi:hypothetical protein
MMGDNNKKTRVSTQFVNSIYDVKKLQRKFITATKENIAGTNVAISRAWW